jgi:hypothetical protein
MKKLFVFLFAVVFSISLFSQTGYKDYTWGMSIDQVKQKNKNVHEDNMGWGSIYYAYLYFNNSNDVLSEKDFFEYLFNRETATLHSGIDDLSFFFENNKLVMVEVNFSNENILPSIQKQYGRKTTKNTRSGRNTYEFVAWRTNSRIIVYNTAGYKYEDVAYVDLEWLDSFIQRILSIVQSKRANTDSKLD